MRHALALARRGWGNTAPNPAVGCVLVQAGDGGRGVVVARGWTQPGGRPHAEAEALRRAGLAAQGATAYVTLEPCAHHGQTPPCADALVAARVARVVVGAGDPDPRVAGRGVEILRAAGIAVETGCLAIEAEAANAGFLSRIETGMPFVTLKVATSLDGQIALENGESRWITGPPARQWGHLLRAQHDGIAVGVETVLADDPRLDCRLPGLARASPCPVVFDSAFRTPLDSLLARRAAQEGFPVWVIGVDDGDGAARRRREVLAGNGVTVRGVTHDARRRVDLAAGLRALAHAGFTRLLVEGGGQLAAALLRQDRVDAISWFRAGLLLGGDARPAVAALELRDLVAAPRFRRADIRPAGEDVLETYVRAS